MKQTENFSKAKGAPAVHHGEVIVQKKANPKLADVNSNEVPANPSLMLWALLGFSADHSYLFTPLS
ncbi:MAG: hypothetical protein ABI723_24855 [Bacteroidia bacterium]